MPSGGQKRIRWPVVGKTAVSVACLALISWRADLEPEVIASELQKARAGLIILAAAGFPLLIFLKSCRWRMLIASSGHNYPLRRAFRSYLAAFAIGVLTPGRLGEFAKGYYLHAEQEIGLPDSLRTVIADRIYDLMFLCSFGFVGYLNIFHDYAPWVWLLQFAAVLAAANGLIAVGTNLLARIRPRQGKQQRLKKLVEITLKDLQGTRALWNWGLTVLAYWVYFSMCYFLLLALGVDLPYLTVCFLVSGMSLVLLLPISIAGFGPREATLLFLLGRYGVTAQGAISFSLLQFFVFFFLGGIIGGVALISAPLPIRHLTPQRPLHDV